MIDSYDPALDAPVKEARDILLKALGEHERGHMIPGEPCIEERINILVFLAQSFQFEPRMVPFILDRIRDRIMEYDRQHEEKHGQGSRT